MANISTIRQPGDGGDYDTIAAWESATDGSLTDDEIGQLFDRTANAPWTENVVIAGATLNGFHRELIADAASGGHTGLKNTGTKLDPAAAGHCIEVVEDDFVIRRLDITLSNGGSSDEGVRIRNSGFKAIRCILRDITNPSGDGLYIVGGVTATAEFCVFQHIDRVAFYCQGQSNARLNAYCCSAINADGDGNQNNAGTMFAYTSNNHNTSEFDARGSYCAISTTSGNNPVAWTAGNNGTFVAACTHNGAEDATSPGGNSQNNLTPASQFVNATAGSEDLHLQAGVALEGAGTDLSAVVTENPALDIDSEEVDWANANIGADQPAAAPAVTGTSRGVETHVGQTAGALVRSRESRGIETHVGQTAGQAVPPISGTSTGIETHTGRTVGVDVRAIIGTSRGVDQQTGRSAGARVVGGVSVSIETHTGRTFGTVVGAVTGVTRGVDVQIGITSGARVQTRDSRGIETHTGSSVGSFAGIVLGTSRGLDIQVGQTTGGLVQTRSSFGVETHLGRTIGLEPLVPGVSRGVDVQVGRTIFVITVFPDGPYSARVDPADCATNSRLEDSGAYTTR